MMRLAAVFAALVVTLSGRAAEATCGSTSCFLVSGSRIGLVPRHALDLTFSFRYVDQTRPREGTRRVAEVRAPAVDFRRGEVEPGHHREVLTHNRELRAEGTWGLTDRLSLVAVVPFLVHKDHEHFEDAGTPDEHLDANAGTRGFGDVQVGGQAALVVASHDLLVGGLLVKLPTGAHRKVDAEGGIKEPTLQPGTGSVDLAASLQYSRQVAAHDWFGSATYRRNTTNDLDYRLGDEAVVTVGHSRRVASRLFASLQLNGRWTDRDLFRAQRLSSTGARLVSVSPGLRVGGGSGSSLWTHIQIPVYQRVNEQQLAPKVGLVAGFSRRF